MPDYDQAINIEHHFKLTSYQTGAGTAMSRLGMADLGLTTFTDMHQNAAMIANINPAVPINVAATVKAYARAGVAGLHIEDQVQEKRCGHLSGKLVVSREVFANRLRAACKARDQSGSGIVIIARTDARAGRDPDGNGGYEEAVARLKMAAEIGVDGLFFEALQSKEEAERAIADLPKIPVLLNEVPGGRTPIVTCEEANKMGFRIAIWPTMGLEAVVPALENAYSALKKQGKSPEDPPLGPGKLFEVCGLKELMEFDESVGGKAYQ
jgi:2-methylisocitrate lyase-like PEP mutase family enzyme